MKLLCMSVTMALAPAHAAQLTLDQDNQPTKSATSVSSVNTHKASNTASSDSNVYIVEFTQPPVATYDGGIKGFKATSNKKTGAKKLNTNSKESKAYRKYLKKNQQDFVANMGKKSEVKYDYQYAFNGVAMTMSAAEAKALPKLFIPG